MMKKLTLIALSVLALSACDANMQATPQQSTNVAADNNAAVTAPAPVAASNSATPSSKKVYRMATEREFTPLIVPAPNGTVTGFEVDVLEAIGKAQGFQVTFVPTDWANVFPMLDAGTVDIAGSGIIITEERLQKWDFSEPFIVAKFAVVVPQDSTIKNSSDLQNKLVAVQPDSTFAEFAQSKTTKIHSTKTIWMSIKEIINKNAEAAMVNTIIAEHFVAKHPNEKLKVVEFQDREIPLGYALKKGNTELQQQINEGLAKIKSDGTYDKLKEKWDIKNH